MIIVDKALEQRENENSPIRVGLVGAGFMGRGMTRQFLTAMKGLRLAAIANRSVNAAEAAYRESGASSIRRVHNLAGLDDAIAAGEYAVTDEVSLLCQSRNLDAIIEATGDVEFSAKVAMSAIEGRKHIILMNAELDATVGPILKVYADRAGVVFTNADGDQPGVVMNLYRFVETIGYRPVLAGNIKGMIDPYRTPETQQKFAAKYHLTPQMATSFADGTKIAMEMAVVANATGCKVGKRGMYGPKCAHVNEAKDLFPIEQLLDGGLVDYVLGAEPGSGVFVLGYNDDPMRAHYIDYFKMGQGPLYVFYVPYHLPHLESPLTVARAVLFGDAAIAPIAGPVCEVITVAKRNLKAGERLDGIGGFTSYGLLENADISRSDNLLPMGLSSQCLLLRDVPKDRAISYDDVALPEGRLCDKLRAEQDAYFL